MRVPVPALAGLPKLGYPLLLDLLRINGCRRLGSRRRADLEVASKPLPWKDLQDDLFTHLLKYTCHFFLLSPG